jgi:transposase
MNRRMLETMVARGWSLEQIGRKVGRHPSTVSYWLDKYGLDASGRDRHRARGGLSRELLTELVAQELTVAEIGRVVDRCSTTVRYWLRFHGLETSAAARRRGHTTSDRTGPREQERPCPKHGLVRHVRRRNGSFRCARCTGEAVTRWRRRAKQRLVEEAGGACALCGYDRCLGALEFHHLDPAAKRFSLSLKGAARAFDTLREEARKCLLLCANCHAEVENGVVVLNTPVGGNSIGRMLGC